MDWTSYFKHNPKSKIKGKIVLITGAAQGIGLHTAAQFAAAGATLILTDINAEKLEEARLRLSKNGVKVSCFQVDVTDKAAVEALATTVIRDFGKLDILINNAGLGHHDELEDTSINTWEKLLNVNLWGPLYHIYAFLPAMKAAKNGHIVNVSSGQAFFRLPTWGAYAAIKLAIGVISEIMHYELRRYGIRVTTVYPYMVNTGFYKDVQTSGLGSRLSMALLPYYSQKPETVAKIIFKAVLRNKRIEMVSPLNVLAKYMHAVPPISNLMNKAVTFFLSDQEGRITEKIPGFPALMLLLASVSQQLQANAGNFGFSMQELMQGEHEFVEGYGPKGKYPMHFKVDWGTDQLLDWLNPFSEQFMVNDLKGTVTIGGFCEDVPCEGSLALRYFQEQKIRYRFQFMVDEQRYEFIGEKRNIYPWNLPYSHTCCFGELRNLSTNELVSTSITHFRLETLVDFVKSFQLVR